MNSPAGDLRDGTRQIELSVPAVHCGACIQAVERTLSGLDGVVSARVNLSTKRVAVRWTEGATPPIAETLDRLGYPPNLFADPEAGKDGTLAELIRAVAVSGFAAGNIMLLSVSVWSGAEGATRDLFHWISALIALPALAFAGRIFYRSAWSALRHGRMNMDVPIAIGVSLAFAMSLYETINHGEQAYFDAAVSLLFFLLIGRTLDHVMRDKARTAVLGLARLAPRGAIVIGSDGSRSYREVRDIEIGMDMLIAAGERIPVDARVLEGSSDLDCSLVSGESNPRSVKPGDQIQAGTLNLTGPLKVQATAAESGSFLAEMLRLMEAAEGGRAKYRRIADRASALYAPLVHLAAFLTFVGWAFADGDWHKALTIAIAVLIITCPCALGLAVPIVQVVAARRLFENGVMVKDGSALERLAEVDTIVFDKTGTLTVGQPRLINADAIPPDALDIAVRLAEHSRHPLSQAIADQGRGSGKAFESIVEKPGYGIEAKSGSDVWRLGRAAWAQGLDETGDAETSSGTVLARNGVKLAAFVFQDALRPDAAKAISALKLNEKSVEMLSGDSEAACRNVSAIVGIDDYRASLLPAGKVARIEALTQAGHKVLMVGDGLNDAPALGAAHVSIAPASAADIGRNAADFVFLRDSLLAVPLALSISRRAGRLVKQNLWLAVLYNAIAVPFAICGYVTPLFAAIAMSGSSLLVIGNALRLSGSDRATMPVAPRPSNVVVASQASA